MASNLPSADCLSGLSDIGADQNPSITSSPQSDHTECEHLSVIYIVLLQLYYSRGGSTPYGLPLALPTPIILQGVSQIARFYRMDLTRVGNVMVSSKISKYMLNIYAQRKLIFISKLGKLNNDVMKVGYNNFWPSDEGVRLQCEFDIAVGVSAEDTKDIVFSKFYDIAICCH